MRKLDRNYERKSAPSQEKHPRQAHGQFAHDPVCGEILSCVEEACRRVDSKSSGFSAALIEYAHDVGIAAIRPGLEPVQPNTCLNLNLLHSAAEQPHQECFGKELYPAIAEKAS